jgi:hypothetical protein
MVFPVPSTQAMAILREDLSKKIKLRMPRPPIEVGLQTIVQFTIHFPLEALSVPAE